MIRLSVGLEHLVIISFVIAVCGHDFIPLEKYDMEAEIRQTLRRTAKSLRIIIDSFMTKREHELYKNGMLLEDVHMPIDALIKKNGYKVETHRVTTEDGYIITFFRIPSSGPPVFLMHGLLMSADDWVTPGPESGMAYLLAAEGYDVWIGNARGVKHAKRHVTMSHKSPQFWNFSWAEIGYHDVPAMIDYVLDTTGASSLHYVCHSQGCTAFFVMASERPEYNEKIKLVVCFAPATAVPNLKSPVLIFLKYATQFHPEIFFSVVKQLGIYEFVPRYELVDGVITNVCGDVELARTICSNIMFLVSGFNPNQLNVTNLPVVFSHTPTGASVKQLEHFAQTIVTRKFQKFNYGPKKNMEVYGAESPPEYRLESISAPVAIFYSDNDWLVTKKDVMNTKRKLNSLVDFYKIPDKNFNHLDFVFAKDMKKLILPRVLKLVRQYT